MNIKRRYLMLGSAAAAVASAQPANAVGTGMIGIGNRGSFLLRAVLAQADAKVLALCDIKPDRLDKAASAAARPFASVPTATHCTSLCVSPNFLR